MSVRIKGFVAFIDVLGFSELVARDKVSQMLDAYRAIIEESTKLSKLQYVVFSDSILLSTPDESEESLWSILAGSSRLLYRFLTGGIPARGTISCGQFVRSAQGRSGVIVAGNPILDAYRYEQLQDWVGIMLSPTLLREQSGLLGKQSLTAGLPQLSPLHTSWCLLFWRCDISFHGFNGKYSGYGVVPLSASTSSPQGAIENLVEVERCLRRLSETAPNPGAQKKYRRTIKWIREVSVAFQGLPEPSTV